MRIDNTIRIPRVVRMCGLVMIGMLLFMGCGRNNNKESSDAKHQQHQELRSISEVEELIRSKDSTNSAEYMDETTLFYRQNNELALDLSQPWNKGTEPLYVFVEKFRSEPQFRKERLALEEGEYDPDSISDFAFIISETDSTGFFSAWSHVDADSAAFCTGWMNSEVLEEFGMIREDSTRLWRLVNYYHAS